MLAPAFFVFALGFAGHARAQDSHAPTQPPATTGAAPAGFAFDVDIRAPQDVQDTLQRHLELMRYRELADLDQTELQRLLVSADHNARELLATLGYFSPDVVVRLEAPTGAPRRVVSITVATGPVTLVSEVKLEFNGPIESDDAALAQREAIRAGWAMRPGTRFTQAGWDSAKAQALRLLAASRYPLARIAASLADVDPPAATARLSLTLDSGPAYRLGPMQVNGLERYDSTLVERLARLNQGAHYDQAALLEAQQRLQDSAYFDSVFVALETAGDPAAAPVVVTLREAKRHKLVLGVGASTDSGARLSVEHTNHQLPGIEWRAVSKLLLDRDTRSIGSELIAAPDAGNWRWASSILLKQENAASVDVRSQRLRAGRSQNGDRIERNYYLQYERANTLGLGLATVAQALSANYAWTQRNFDSLPFPSSGYGLGVELGGGSTIGRDPQPYVRAVLQGLAVWSLAEGQERPRAAPAGRIVLRAQGGAVLARSDASLPSTQLFLLGGDASVRGYGYHGIGAAAANGQTTPGRTMLNASVEWQRPISYAGQSGEWEHTLFVDGGAVADRPADFRARFGVGTGVRWNSPVGPLQMDLAYGIAVQRWHLHMSVGFRF